MLSTSPWAANQRSRNRNPITSLHSLHCRPNLLTSTSTVGHGQSSKSKSQVTSVSSSSSPPNTKQTMPPKARKSGINNWYTCEACGVVLSQKDVQIHNSSACPPCETDWDYAFIKDRVLFSHLELSDIDGDPCVKGNKKQFFVFMSQSAMQLCQFKIGEQIVLSLNETDSIVRTVFPTYDRSLTSVTIAPVISGINQTLLKESCRVKVHKVPDKPLPAASIRLTTFSEIAVDRVDQLVTVTKQFYSGKLLRRGLELNVPFFGKSVDMIVKDITPLKCATDGSLEDQFEHLNINKASSTEPYFLVIEKSNWLISLKGKNKEKEVKSKFTSLSDVGGYKELIQELVRSISVVLKRTSSSSHFSSSLGILLYGPNGVGKTFLSEALANEFEVPVVKISSGELFSKFYGETELRLRNLFTEAKDKSPSIIILDNIDTLCPRRGGTEQERRVISYLLTLLDSLKGYKVVVLATTSQINLIDTALRRPGRLDYEVELPIPSRDDRFEILKVLLAKWTVEESELMQLASVAHGYVAADLQSLVTRAVMRAVSCDKTCDGSDLHWALALTNPSAMREVMVQVPNVKWTDIGGMDDLKLKLQQSIEWPLRHPEAFTRLGISPPRGVLMYGPPGCSKTMIAKALATESKLNFLSIKGSELFSKWVGESEKAVQSLFKKARAVAPSIVFLDELDALGGERSGQSEGSNVQERVLAQLLTEMDGVEPLGNVNIVGATNRPDRIDKALLRPGRLDRMVYVPLPDLETRICILQLQLVKMPVAGDIVIDDLALKTEAYSGAEVVAVCHEAAMSALQEDFNVSEVCERHFVSALEMVKPRTPWSLLELYDTYTKL